LFEELLENVFNAVGRELCCCCCCCWSNNLEELEEDPESIFFGRAFSNSSWNISSKSPNVFFPAAVKVTLFRLSVINPGFNLEGEVAPEKPPLSFFVDEALVFNFFAFEFSATDCPTATAVEAGFGGGNSLTGATRFRPDRLADASTEDPKEDMS